MAEWDFLNLKPGGALFVLNIQNGVYIILISWLIKWYFEIG